MLVGLVLVLLGGGQLLRDRRAALEADLRLEAIRQLSIEGVMGVNPVLHGRRATLEGKVVSEGEKQRAASVVAGVEGIRSVTNELEIGPWYQPTPLRYFLDVAWRSDGINAKGRVPDEATKALVLEMAATDFGPDLVIDRIEVDGSLGPGSWIADLAPLLPELTGNVSPGRVKAAEGEDRKSTTSLRGG